MPGRGHARIPDTPTEHTKGAPAEAETPNAAFGMRRVSPPTNPSYPSGHRPYGLGVSPPEAGGTQACQAQQQHRVGDRRRDFRTFFSLSSAIEPCPIRRLAKIQKREESPVEPRNDGAADSSSDWIHPIHRPYQARAGPDRPPDAGTRRDQEFRAIRPSGCLSAPASSDAEAQQADVQGRRAPASGVHRSTPGRRW